MPDPVSQYLDSKTIFAPNIVLAVIAPGKVQKLSPGFQTISADLMRGLRGRMHFVPEGQHDSSQARSAWDYEKNSPVPAERLNRAWLRNHSINLRPEGAGELSPGNQPPRATRLEGAPNRTY